MLRVDRREKGFTIIELTLVIAIIGILAAIAIPKYMNYQCRAKQVEGRQGLGTLAKFQEVYHSLNDTYSLSQDAIGFSMKGFTVIYYDYAITDADEKTFKAEAVAKTTSFFGKEDIWNIDHTLALLHLKNACTE
jgi:type IV pilus assembly protein PilA